jgi:putative adhesin
MNIPRLLLLAVLLTSLMAVVCQADVTTKVHQNWGVSSAASFELADMNGSIEVSGWDKPEIDVTATIKARSQEMLDAVHVRMAKDGDAVHVTSEYNPKIHNSNATVNYKISLPKRLASVKLRMTNGSIDSRSVGGDLSFISTNGRIRASDLFGRALARTTNGSIDADIQSGGFNQPMQFDSTNGAIVVRLDPATNATLDASTQNGSIQTDFGLAPSHKFGFSENQAKGAIGSGGPELRAHAQNGSIQIRKK